MKLPSGRRLVAEQEEAGEGPLELELVGRREAHERQGREGGYDDVEPSRIQRKQRVSILPKGSIEARQKKKD